MTEFDLLIRNKANKAQYPYRTSAWRNFLHKAGKMNRTFSHWQTAAITMGTVIIIGGILWGILRSPNPTGLPPVIAPPHQKVDTITTQPAEQQPTELIQPEAKPVKKATQETARPVAEPSDRTTTDTSHYSTIGHKTVKSKKINREQLGRPIHINPDTIKDNIPTDEQLRNGHSRIAPI